ncbi:MAG: aminomethyl-transferring glycine dehydrogenase [Acidimicrobiia bacterium]|nr:aminomethyl-transferring glycine dehydrogenase [Acidimicrobiia bacterium]MYC58521.1 aminomethyl-transferring glycine dehydrogenase [Acidimicrobiia bacterium]MYG94279.1 aminomethyl-transferring glycine dehydrogenase [Acidimicrobiia bacterium]MYI30373.1 aminomethyl-transferring glycine dehydrogenase [Acidimicrobiia bacterium]
MICPPTPSIAELDNPQEFLARHIGPTTQEQALMLSELGFDSIDALLDAVVPSNIRSKSPLDLPPPMTEAVTTEALRKIAGRNIIATSLIGMGYYNTITPAVIRRNVLENPTWYTAYTPYQPEISQGRLEALINFQTMVTDLTGMGMANASLLDEGTAAAEAMTLLRRLNRKTAKDRFVVDADTHPQTMDVIHTRAAPLGIEVEIADLNAANIARLAERAFAVLVSYPASSGRINDIGSIISEAHNANALVSVASDLLALCLLTPPGELGADVVVGSSQRFGVPLGFGGPHAGFIAVREAAMRSLPGRLVGVSVDDTGAVAYRLALQTREQHIRREKATSNICTAQVLLAVMAAMYAIYHGPEGLTRIATRTHRLTAIAAAGLREAGYELAANYFFDTVTVSTPNQASQVTAAALREGLNLRRVDNKTVAFSLDETSTATTLDVLWRAFNIQRSPDSHNEAIQSLDSSTPDALPTNLRRSSSFLTHPVFNSYHSETEMLRYLQHLASKDLALDRSMIPLGSCTMKLNAAVQMEPISWPEFAQIHPFAPSDQTQGYRALIADLEQALLKITGYAAISLQPNAGAQGELAGLLAIRAYHAAQGQNQRNICLIPASAHGTNAASAIMAGMQVVVVACDADGNVDIADLKSKAVQHAEQLSTLMVTYPSTHGVFETHIVEVCDLIHLHGGQVYLDGANLNALVGIAQPGQFGADVSHLNLHKTFCIPHGGGGPGVGPIAVGAHLAPYLPKHALVPEAGPSSGVGAVSSAPWGSAGILPISWAYITAMGANGLTQATRVALLNANYLAARLKNLFPLLYTGSNGLVAHECIIDLRPLHDRTGVTVDDVAKRLIDFGFHAPTVSFPVAGTLMVEPTESESKAELDRFVAAMSAIRAEIQQVADGIITIEKSPLRRAPHTATAIADHDWDRPYSRKQAVFGLQGIADHKYWPPVGRIDGAYGDKNVFCTCPPLEDLTDSQ